MYKNKYIGSRIARVSKMLVWSLLAAIAAMLPRERDHHLRSLEFEVSVTGTEPLGMRLDKEVRARSQL